MSSSFSKTLASSSSAAFLVARQAVYNTPNIAKVTTISPIQMIIGKIWEVVTDPLQLLSAVYLLCMVGLVVGGVTGKLTRLFKHLTKSKSNKTNTDDDEELKVFECEVCRMQLRPARGRAQKILSRKNFICSNCGAKGSAFFDIHNLQDPRAIKRLERLKKEEEDENLAYDD
jgi:RNase P subunit RPR2